MSSFSALLCFVPISSFVNTFTNTASESSCPRTLTKLELFQKRRKPNKIFMYTNFLALNVTQRFSVIHLAVSHKTFERVFISITHILQIPPHFPPSPNVNTSSNCLSVSSCMSAFLGLFISILMSLFLHFLSL